MKVTTPDIFQLIKNNKTRALRSIIEEKGIRMLSVPIIHNCCHISPTAYAVKIAMHDRCMETLKTILELGATELNPEYYDEHGIHSPLFRITEALFDYTECYEVFRPMDEFGAKLVTLLCSYGFDANARDSEYATIMLRAAQIGALNVVKALIRHGGDPYVFTPSGILIQDCVIPEDWAEIEECYRLYQSELESKALERILDGTCIAEYKRKSL